MCFSAPVSFAASATIAVIGAGVVGKAKTRQELPLALIPLLFAAQQLVEGLLWLVLPKAGFGSGQYWLTQSYAVFIGVIWPTLIPLSLFIAEPETIRRRLIQAIFTLGIAVAFYTAYIIATSGVQAAIAEQCIVYHYAGDQMPGNLPVYFAATCLGFFFSSHRSLRWIGIAQVSGFFVAYYFYRFNYASVWCFFAAATSGLIYLHFQRLRERESLQKARA